MRTWFFNFFNNHNKDGYQYSSFLLFILNYFNVNIPEDPTPLEGFSYGVFLLSLVSIISFINILITFFILYKMKDYDYETKFINYPFIIRIIKLYLNVSILTIILECLFCFISLLLLLISSGRALGIFLF